MEAGSSSVSTHVVHSGFSTISGLVGLVLRAGGGRVDHVISAFRDDNSDADLRVVDHGDLVEIWATGSLLVTVDTLRWHLGRHFGIAQLKSMLVSSTGTVKLDGDHLKVVSEGGRTAALEWSETRR